jgi:LmbE family N-acetylglucosaminyl deacetylase
MPYRVAAVYAHPDDDTFGIGGFLALHAGEVDLTLILATSGEASELGAPSPAAAEELGSVREREERAALDALGVGGADVHLLRYPDGRLAAVAVEELVTRLVAILEPRSPQVIMTFGPEGITGHDDHIAIHTAATEAFHRLQAEGSPHAPFGRLFYNAIRRSDLERFRRMVQDQGLEVGDLEGPFMPRGVPDHTVSVCVDCHSVLDRKLAAVRAHRSQLGDLGGLPENLLKELLGMECFVQAWPPVTDPEGPMLSDPLEGLEPVRPT